MDTVDLIDGRIIHPLQGLITLHFILIVFPIGLVPSYLLLLPISPHKVAIDGLLRGALMEDKISIHTLSKAAGSLGHMLPSSESSMSILSSVRHLFLLVWSSWSSTLAFPCWHKGNSRAPPSLHTCDLHQTSQTWKLEDLGSSSSRGLGSGGCF